MEDPVVLHSVHCIFVDEFGNVSQATPCTYKSNVKLNSIGQLKANLLQRFAFGSNPSKMDQWSLTLNGVSVDDSASLKRRLGSFSEDDKNTYPYLFVLSYKKPLVISQKRARDERTAYDIARRLRAIIDGGIDVYVNDLKSNGMITQRVLHFLNFIRTRLEVIQTPVDEYTIVTTDDLPLERLPRNTLCLAPFLEDPQHTSLVCLYNGRIMLHLDASGSTNRHNRSIYSFILSKHMPEYSLTYINYQTFDKEGGDNTSYAGGNCSCFALYHVPRLLLMSQTYLTSKFGFDAFWSRFTRVCELSKEQSVVCEMCIVLGETCSPRRGRSSRNIFLTSFCALLSVFSRLPARRTDSRHHPQV